MREVLFLKPDYEPSDGKIDFKMASKGFFRCFVNDYDTVQTLKGVEAFPMTYVCVEGLDGRLYNIPTSYVKFVRNGFMEYLTALREHGVDNALLDKIREEYGF